MRLKKKPLPAKKTRTADAETRKTLIKGQFAKRHYLYGSAVLAVMVLGTRKRQVSQLPLTVEAASDAPEHVQHADFLRAWLRDGVLDEVLFDLLSDFQAAVAGCDDADLAEIAKTEERCVILVGQENKTGEAAGSQQMPHLVDVVLELHKNEHGERLVAIDPQYRKEVEALRDRVFGTARKDASGRVMNG